MTVTFRQLEVFVEAAKDSNFRKTADRLGISQPAVSNQVRALEERFGAQLFSRTRGATPRISADGLVFLHRAQALLASHTELARSGPADRTRAALTLRIAAGPFLLDHHIRPALPRFLERHPHLTLDFPPPCDAKKMRELIRTGEADIATYTGDWAAGSLRGAEVICDIPCAIYGSARFEGIAAESAHAIDRLPFVLPLAGTPAERWVLKVLRRRGIRPRNVVARSQFSDVICGMVGNGKGVSVLFDEQMAQLVEAGRVVRLGPQLECGSRVLLIGRRARSRAAAPVLVFLREILGAGAASPIPTICRRQRGGDSAGR